jgi:hypothetical protein
MWDWVTGRLELFEITIWPSRKRMEYVDEIRGFRDVARCLLCGTIRERFAQRQGYLARRSGL